MYVFLEKIMGSLTILSKIIWEQIREGKIILNWMDRKYIPLTIEYGRELKFGMAAGPYPLVNEHCHVFAGHSKYGLHE